MKIATFLRKLNFFVYQYLLIVAVSGVKQKKTYGNGYGITWIFMPDGDNRPHLINLTSPEYDYNFFRSQSDLDIEYRLFTRKNPNVYETLDESGKVIQSICDGGCFIRNASVKIVTHGWRSTADKSSVILLRDAILARYDINVIAVDWGAISMSYMYPKVALDTKEVGAAVGKFIDHLAEKYNLSGDDIHLIGHSLGAHVMGNAASSSNLNISRVTGLDPARPMFEIPLRNNNARLDPSDAQFVDAIHTCAGILGFEGQVGHIDFYPNNGISPQPGCKGLQEFTEACSHGRAHIYFSESIRLPKSFKAFRCNSWDNFLRNNCKNESVYIGEEIDRSMRGTFYLETNSQSPFGTQMSTVMSDVAS